jgi:hypothetical protein
MGQGAWQPTSHRREDNGSGSSSNGSSDVMGQVLSPNGHDVTVLEAAAAAKQVQRQQHG